MVKIAVIGAGVTGLAVALQTQEYFGSTAQVTVLSDDFSPNTTGDGSAGLWGPYLSGSTPEDWLIKWGQIGHDYMHRLWKMGYAQEAGISLLPVTRLRDDIDTYEVSWKHIVFGWQNLTKEEVAKINQEQSKQFLSGAQYLTFTCEPTKWLPFLLKQFRAAGGRLKQQRILNFNEIANDFDLIVNCSGLFSQVLANDQKVVSIRGQVMYAKAPWQFHSVLDDSAEGNYIIPNIDWIVLGGTHQYEDYNRNVDPRDSRFIWDGCVDISKSMKNAVILKEWVGLRPGRDRIRLEEETFIAENGKKIKIIHNYGHGGCGVTFAWGCAADILRLIRENIGEHIFPMKGKI